MISNTKTLQTTESDSQDSHQQLLSHLPQLPPDIQGVAVGNIPLKYHKPRTVRLPYHGLSIDATIPQINYMTKLCKTTKPNEKDMWRNELKNIFTPQPLSPKEQTFDALSVRSLWDLYFQVR